MCNIIFFSGQPHGPPTPPTTPKTDLHHGVKQDLKLEVRRLVDSNRQNIDFSNVDISELSTDVISNMETFDVHEFDQYLPLNGHAPGSSTLSSDHSHGQAPVPGGSYTSSYSHAGANGSVWSRKSAMSSSTPSASEVGQHRLHIKTEQLSPSHYSEHSHGSPSHSDYGSYSSHACVTSATSAASAAASFSSSQCDYTDLQSSNYYNPYSGYPSSLYQYPYFHSSRRPYGSPILNSLSMAPAHSPNASSWDQPVYTTLSRPWRGQEAVGSHQRLIQIDALLMKEVRGRWRSVCSRLPATIFNVNQAKEKKVPADFIQSYIVVIKTQTCFTKTNCVVGEPKLLHEDVSPTPTSCTPPPPPTLFPVLNNLIAHT